MIPHIENPCLLGPLALTLSPVRITAKLLAFHRSHPKLRPSSSRERAIPARRSAGNQRKKCRRLNGLGVLRTTSLALDLRYSSGAKAPSLIEDDESRMIARRSPWASSR